MKIKVILLSILLIFSITAISCKRSASPFDPGSLAQGQSGTASLTGSIILAGTSITDFNLINVGIKGTNLAVNPDKNGNFRITQLPLGSLIIEIYVENNISDIPVDDVESGEEIQMAVEIQSDNSAVLTSISRNKKSADTLQLDIQPKHWNFAWANSEGGVHARINGPGFDEIDCATIQMVGPEGAMVIPYKCEVGGVYFKAWFYKNEVIGIISDPQRGIPYEIQITGTFNDGSSFTETFTLTDTITIVGEKSADTDLSLEIKPKKWNIAWVESEDEVSAHISGEGFADIVLEHLQMSCASCLEPGELDVVWSFEEELGGVSYIAKFLQSEAIRLLKDPKRGELYEIQVTGSFGVLTDTITIVGKKSGEGELTLEIKPDKWNMAWANGDEDGEVTARIKGEDFDKIDPLSVVMSGLLGGGPITPIDTEVAGFTFIAKFSQSQAITLIPDPPTESNYEIHVTVTLIDGITSFDLPYWITIKGKK